MQTYSVEYVLPVGILEALGFVLDFGGYHISKQQFHAV